MTLYVIAQIDVHDDDAYEAYRRAVPAIIQAFGGRYLARGGRTEALEGPATPGRTVILAFPDEDAYRRFFGSAQYAPYKALRNRVAESRVFTVQGL
jgi:uncharacterized protein (DUF1330 family)